MSLWFFLCGGSPEIPTESFTLLYCILLRRNSRQSSASALFSEDRCVDYRYITSYAFPIRLRTIHGGVVAFGLVYISFFLFITPEREREEHTKAFHSLGPHNNKHVGMYVFIHPYILQTIPPKHHSSQAVSAQLAARVKALFISRGECIVNIKTSSCQQYA